MIPKFLAHIDSPYPKIRAHALSCVIQFISPDNNALTTLHLEPFIVGLFKHASDDSTEVRKIVCQALVQLLATRPDVLIPHLPNVVEFMLYSTQASEDEDVALEACEFWLTFAEDPELVNQLRPFLPKVIPVLLQCMVYSEDDILILDTEEDDAAVPDKASDIKPHLLSSKAHVAEREEDPSNPSNGNGGGGASRSRADGGDSDEEEEDEDDYDEEDDETYTEWNLRKCSAAALDVMAVAFEAEMLEVLLPYLKEKLFSSDWLDVESGVLALGAIAEGKQDLLAESQSIGADIPSFRRLHHRYRTSPPHSHELPHRCSRTPETSRSINRMLDNRSILELDNQGRCDCRTQATILRSCDGRCTYSLFLYQVIDTNRYSTSYVASENVSRQQQASSRSGLFSIRNS